MFGSDEEGGGETDQQKFGLRVLTTYRWRIQLSSNFSLTPKYL